MNILRFKVSSRENGMRLLAFLRENCPKDHSVKSLKRAIEARHCKINGRVECFSSKILAVGDSVELDLSLVEEKKPKKIPILYEDQDLLICDKPAGIICENRELNRLLSSYRGSLKLAHRLDKDTSGVVILVKNQAMQETLIDLFTQREVHKTYLAIVDGSVNKREGKIKNYLGKKHSYQGQTIWGSVSKEKGVLAITAWKCLKKTAEASLLQCEPETGRTHQLRVHLSEMGHPILGDYQYGREFICQLQPKRQLLHAFKIRFRHPMIKKMIEIEAPIPPDFKKALKELDITW